MYQRGWKERKLSLNYFMFILESKILPLSQNTFSQRLEWCVQTPLTVYVYCRQTDVYWYGPHQLQLPPIFSFRDNSATIFRPRAQNQPAAIWYIWMPQHINSSWVEEEIRPSIISTVAGQSKMPNICPALRLQCMCEAGQIWLLLWQVLLLRAENTIEFPY